MDIQWIGIECSPIQFLTSGGGSKAWRGAIDFDRMSRDETKFYYDGQGFMSMQINQAEAKINFYDIFGQILHTLNLTKQIKAAVDDDLAAYIN